MKNESVGNNLSDIVESTQSVSESTGFESKHLDQTVVKKLSFTI